MNNDQTQKKEFICFRHFISYQPEFIMEKIGNGLFSSMTQQMVGVTIKLKDTTSNTIETWRSSGKVKVAILKDLSKGYRVNLCKTTRDVQCFQMEVFNEPVAFIILESVEQSTNSTESKVELDKNKLATNIERLKKHDLILRQFKYENMDGSKYYELFKQFYCLAWETIVTTDNEKLIPLLLFKLLELRENYLKAYVLEVK